MSHSLRIPSVGLIGAGAWGKNIARAFHGLAALRVICDHHKQLLEGYKAQYPEVRVSTDYLEVLKDPSVHQVVIATSAPSHYQLAREALLAGKDVYVEKPLCLDLQQGQALVQLAEQRQKVLMVGHILQYHPAVRKAHELVASGELGELLYISAHRLNLGRFCAVESSLWSLAPHDISVILSLCKNQLPSSVQAVAGAETNIGVADTTLTTLTFQEGPRAHIYVSWLNPFKEQKLTLVGSRGMLVFDDTLSWDQKLRVSRFTAGRPSEVQHVEVVALEQSEPLRNECSHFLECCQGRHKPCTDGEEALRVLSVLSAAEESLQKNGERVHLLGINSALQLSISPGSGAKICDK